MKEILKQQWETWERVNLPVYFPWFHQTFELNNTDAVNLYTTMKGIHEDTRNYLMNSHSHDSWMKNIPKTQRNRMNCSSDVCLYKLSEGWDKQHVSAGKAIALKPHELKFNLWILCSRNSESVFANCPMTSTCTLWHMHTQY